MLVLTTCAGPAEAERLADRLVEARLAACVNRIDSVASTYRWQGNIERDHESLLLIKTTKDRYPALEEAIREQSSYDVPEVIAVPLAAGASAYLGWLSAAVQKEKV